LTTLVLEVAKSCWSWAKLTRPCRGFFAPPTQHPGKSAWQKRSAWRTLWSCKVVTLVVLMLQALLLCLLPSQSRSLATGLASVLLVDTELEGVRIRRNSGKLKHRLSQGIFRVSDLRQAFD